MTTGLLSQTIEALPELDSSHCVLMTGVPKASGSAWTFDSSIEGTSTTRLYLNSQGRWQNTSVGGFERACAAANAAINDTGGNIYLYPSAKIGAYTNQRMDLYDNASDLGNYYTVIESKQQVVTTKEVSASWNASISTYWDWRNNYATKTNIPKNTIAFEFTDYASPAGSSRALVSMNYGYYEGSARALPFNIVPVELPKITGSVSSIQKEQNVAVDMSGNYFGFSYFLPAIRHGIYDDVLALETPLASASSFYGYEHRAKTKFLTNDNLMMSAINAQFVYIYPTFGSNSIESVFNSDSYEVVPSPTPGGTFNDTLQRWYPYYYEIRRYRVLDESGAMFNRRSWKPNITVAVPAVTYTRTPCADPFQWTPHTPPDYSSTHHFVLTGDYSTQGQPSWQLRRKTPFASGEYYEPRVSGVKAPPFAYSNTSYLFAVPDQNGDHRQTDLLAPGYAVNVNRTWNFGCVQLEGGAGAGTGRVSHKFVQFLADGSEVDLTSWSDLTRTPFYSYDGTDYIAFTGSTSLAALGITDPQNYRSNVWIRVRYYYIAISPYDSGQAVFGNNWSFSSNYKGSFNDWQDEASTFPLDIPPMKLITNQGDVISTDWVPGYHDKFHEATVTYTGSFTPVISAVGGGFYTIGMTSNLTPACADTDLVAMYRFGEVQRRITRKSDGCSPHQFFYSKTTHGGIVWSKKAKSWYITPSSPTNGTGVLASFPIAFTIPGQLVDVAPGASGETFEVETILKIQLDWLNHRTTYVSYRDVQTITV